MTTIRLTRGTLEPNDNMDGWVITSEMAISQGSNDLPLLCGDKIRINGDVYRNGEFLGNIS